MGREWSMRIDGWHPTRLNVWMRLHWAQRKKRLGEHAALLLASARNAGIPRVSGECKRTVGLGIILGKRARGADPDAYWKSLLDALVAARLLWDDSWEHCAIVGPTYSREKQNATVITIGEE